MTFFGPPGVPPPRGNIAVQLAHHWVLLSVVVLVPLALAFNLVLNRRKAK
jgi:hypothetical protein